MNTESDPRLLFSIGTSVRTSAEGEFDFPTGLAFDPARGTLLVADLFNHRIQVFSSDDGSLVRTFGSEGRGAGHLSRPVEVTVDAESDRIVVADTDNHRVQFVSASDYSFVSSVGKQGGGPLEFSNPRAPVIDLHLGHIILSDSGNNRAQVLTRDGAFVREIRHDSLRIDSMAIDNELHRLVITDTRNHRVQVLSSIDGSFLFKFGSKGMQPGSLSGPFGVCIDNRNRIIVADYNNRRLQAFTASGQYVTGLACAGPPTGVAFDEHRGLIAFIADNRVHVIGANQWLADTFTWRPERHRHAPSWMKQAILTMAMIRSVVDESNVMSMIPNELLFEIFSFL